MAVSFKGAHFPKEIILMGVRWYVAYPLAVESRSERLTVTEQFYALAA